MEIVSAVAAPAVETLMNPVTKNLHYVISCTEYVSDMKEKIDHLNHMKNDVQDIMVSFKHNNLHIPSCVPSWLKKVEDINAEVEKFPSDVGRSNLIDKHKYGKHALKIMERVNRLMVVEKSIKGSDHKLVEAVSEKESTSEPSRDHHDSEVPTPSSDHDDLQSRKQTSTEELKALESGHESDMVASCCMGGVGKTATMENKKKFVIEKKRFNFIIKSKNIVRDMNDKIVHLNHTSEDVKDRMRYDETRNRAIPSHVHDWLKDVEDVNASVESIPSDVSSCGLKIRPKLQKKALEIIQNIDRLIDEESRIKWPDHGISFGKVVSVNASTSTASSHQDDFESRQQTFLEALKALESNHKSHMVALCGVGGVGKTTMMEKLVAIERKIFHFIIKVIVGEKTNIIAIQQVVAAYLGLDLAGGNKDTRANELRKCFRAYSRGGTRKFLIVLDDVWEFVDLTDIGLSPLPNQGVDFKILLTSRNREVCIEMGVEVDLILDVKLLMVQEAKSLFVQFARISEDVDLDLDLHNIGDEIAIKCQGIPIAIKIIACTLRGQRKEVWEDALSKLNRHQLHEVVDQIFEMSYNNLQEEETRSTLLLCGLFHKDLDTPKEDLVRYGWGLNLFSNVYTIQEARNRLNGHIERLIDANLLIKSQDVRCVMMHDLVRASIFRMYSKGEQPNMQLSSVIYQSGLQKIQASLVKGFH